MTKSQVVFSSFCRHRDSRLENVLPVFPFRSAAADATAPTVPREQHASTPLSVSDATHSPSGGHRGLPAHRVRVSKVQVPPQGRGGGQDFLPARADQNQAHGDRDPAERKHRLWREHVRTRLSHVAPSPLRSSLPSSLHAQLPPGGVHGWRACVHTPSRVAPPVGRHQLPQGQLHSLPLLAPALRSSPAHVPLTRVRMPHCRTPAAVLRATRSHSSLLPQREAYTLGVAGCDSRDSQASAYACVLRVPCRYNESDTIAKYEIMDGAPVRGVWPHALATKPSPGLCRVETDSSSRPSFVLPGRRHTLHTCHRTRSEPPFKRTAALSGRRPH